MHIQITDYDRVHRIAAIKGIRAVSGLGLQESKDITDAIDVGKIPPPIEVSNTNDSYFHSYVTFTQCDPLPAEVIEAFLAQLPGEMTIAQVRVVLGAMPR